MAGVNMILRDVFILFLLASVAVIQAGVIDVTTHGAMAGGSDNAKGFLSAWQEACASSTAATMVIPKGTFLVGPVTFAGPCKAAIEFQITGTMQAPADVNAFKGKDGWVVFSHVDKLTVTGGGTFDGQGQSAWSHCSSGQNCQLPINIRFDYVTNSVVSGITSLNSKDFHINVLECKHLSFDHVTVTAPGTSPNTDGIHIGRSSVINITDSNIGTGDDCISIGDGSEQIGITGVNCGPGHGISVGSLGKYNNEAPVVGIFVKHCTLTKTMNGIRIKTWPASPPGIARDMHFDDITMNGVGNPILIDQGYCPYNQCKAQVPSKVKISDVSFKGIRGSSSTQVAVKLMCSKAAPCENVEIGDISLKFNGGSAMSECQNFKPTLSGKQDPPIACV